VRANSRQRGSRDGAGDNNSTYLTPLHSAPHGLADLNASSSVQLGVGLQESIATTTSAATASRFGMLIRGKGEGEEGGPGHGNFSPISAGTGGLKRSLDSPINANRLSPTTVEAPNVAALPPLGAEREYESIALSQIGASGEWETEKYEHPIDKSKWTDFKVGHVHVHVHLHVRVRVHVHVPV